MASDTPNLDPQDRRSEIAAPAPNGEDHAQPVRRGKGRPPGSRNKPKSARQPGTAQPGGDNPATREPKILVTGTTISL